MAVAGVGRMSQGGIDGSGVAARRPSWWLVVVMLGFLLPLSLLCIDRGAPGERGKGTGPDFKNLGVLFFKGKTTVVLPMLCYNNGAEGGPSVSLLLQEDQESSGQISS
ncbi:hypothetical protein RHMOL_Rhmol13G0186700 [Rhododendron molle]|uniref:Uncharacterized protein n=1 Tax=Rhododendron molle TaxID=49168 RepID=A0ACC0L9K4_RHOML|nr:hypothetical protein RHMOL_Rhmol13G0186700 [Rhododendron molle]